MKIIFLCELCEDIEFMKEGVYTARNVEKNDARFRCLCVKRALTMNNVKYHGKREGRGGIPVHKIRSDITHIIAIGALT